MNEKLLVFESMLDFKAYELIPSTKRGCSGQKETRVEQGVRTSKNVKNRQTRIIDNNYELLTNLIEDNNLLERGKILLLQLNKEYDIPGGIVGLIANKFATTYQRPTLILN